MRWLHITKEQKVRRRIKKLGEWHKWFAWYPVQVKDEKVWLEILIRKGKHHGFVSTRQEKREFYNGTGGVYESYSNDASIPVFNWEYRTDEFDLIKNPTKNG